MEPATSNGRPHSSMTRISQLHEQNEMLLQRPSMTSPSNVSSKSSRRTHTNLTEVVTTSGNTNDLVRNISTFINDRIPPAVSICTLIVLSVIAFVLILIGTFNIPFCQVQPMIPIWLIMAGVLFIMSATIRIFRLIPSPRQRSSTLSMDLCCRISENLFLVINVVWLTLGDSISVYHPSMKWTEVSMRRKAKRTGCIWVYGSKPWVHFEDHMFEEHYCDRTLYWIAFWTCTLYLIALCILISLMIIFMAVVSTKETAENGLDV